MEQEGPEGKRDIYRKTELPLNDERTLYHGALYMRLSKDDAGTLESASIISQRKMLYAYAKENRFQVYDEYVDDGYSGTSFDRPEFRRLIKDIEAQRVNLVITKDLSRLGRDYIATGQYTEIYFPSKKVRYIAINDGYDSKNQINDIVPFKNVINEMYARDTSKKIRTAFITRMKDGSYIGNFAPYGYCKDPEDRHHLVVDETAGAIVKSIFELADRGMPPSSIARQLNQWGYPSPAVYRCSQYPHLNPEHYTRRGEWTPGTIGRICGNKVYLGHMAQGKSTKVSFKSRMTLKKPREDWVVVENTHAPLIEEELFRRVQKRREARTRAGSKGFCNLFSGIAKCAECGKNMSSVGNRKMGSPADLACGSYKLYGKNACTNHFIEYNTLYRLVLTELRTQAHLEAEDIRELIKDWTRDRKAGEASPDHGKEKKLAEKRLRELDHLIEKLYDDHSRGLLDASRLEKLLSTYEKEYAQIQGKLKVAEAGARETKPSVKDLEEVYLKRIKDLAHIKELTPDLLFRLVDRIEIGQGYYEKTSEGEVKHQSIRIVYRFSATPSTTRHFF